MRIRESEVAASFIERLLTGYRHWGAQLQGHPESRRGNRFLGARLSNKSCPVNGEWSFPADWQFCARKQLGFSGVSQVRQCPILGFTRPNARGAVTTELQTAPAL